MQIILIFGSPEVIRADIFDAALNLVLIIKMPQTSRKSDFCPTYWPHFTADDLINKI